MIYLRRPKQPLSTHFVNAAGKLIAWGLLALLVGLILAGNLWAWSHVVAWIR